MSFKNIMKIDNFNSSGDKPQFYARKIANIKHNNFPHLKDFELYSLDRSEIDFTRKMATKINLKKLYPNIDSYDCFQEWKNIIINASNRIDNDVNAVLAVYDKKPCGIMIYKKYHDLIYLNYLTKWRIKPDFDLPNIGKMLMRNLFGVAAKNNIDTIALTPAKCKPRGKSCVDFYKELGFKEKLDGSLTLQDTNFEKKCAQIENYFEYQNVNNSNIISANKKFSCNFNESLIEKIKKLFSNL